MLSEDRWLQFGTPRKNGLEDIKCIVIHNTGSDLSARDIFDYLQNKSQDSRSCHYLVDHNEVIDVMPLDYVAWNTGVAYDYGNMHGIAVEICSNQDEDIYLQGQDKAIELIKKLMEEHNLTKNDIYFHNDFLQDYNCPATILQMYKTRKNFIEKFF